MKKLKKDNPVLLSLVGRLLKEKKPIWKKIAGELSRPRRSRVEVNVSRLDVHTKDNATVVIPGKVLGSGNLSKKLTVAAFSFSENARKIINDAGGKAISIEELCRSNPEGKGVLVIK